jgi:hypothetical protein
MRTSPTSSVMSEVTKRLEIGPELWFRVMPAGRFEVLRFYGAIAQLGERLHGMQEVGGSIPPGSTTLRPSGYAWRSRAVPEERSVSGVAQRAKTGW